MLADRRLSYGSSRAPKENGRKLMFLEATDGVAILGYAGLGATALGTEPADWMSNVLRGRKLSIEQSLGVLADAAKDQLPKHLVRIVGPAAPAHSIIVPCFVEEEARLYSIDLAFSRDRKDYSFRYTRHVVQKRVEDTPRTARIALVGSGALFLHNKKSWMRALLRLVRAHDRGQIKPRAVSDYLAELNNDVHVGLTDGSVGPRCIVAWRHRKSGVHKGGGAQEFYDGLDRDSESSSIPTIANGMDVSALIGAIMPHVLPQLESTLSGEKAKELDKDEINAELARLPDRPDEKLK